MTFIHSHMCAMWTKLSSETTLGGKKMVLLVKGGRLPGFVDMGRKSDFDNS